MKISTNNVFGFLGGISLLIFPVFFDSKFNSSLFSAIIYMVLVSVGMIISLFFFAKLFYVKPVLIFTIAFVLELGIYLSFFAVKNNWIQSQTINQKYHYFYTSYLRSLTTFQKGLGQYDIDLFYTLQPGKGENSNLEFSNTYQINSKGLRDDEASLNYPEIIVLGDSHTMGFGVEQEDTYSNRLETSLQKKVLNAGISSYGSAREFLMYKRLKSDSCKTIIWQYCPNDAEENKSFLDNKNQLHISSEEVYNSSCNRNFIRSNYYPFKLLFEGVSHSFRKFITKKVIESQKIDISSECLNFFKIISLLQKTFDGNIIVFNLESHSASNDFFLQAEKTLTSKKITLIDFTKILTKEHYYKIDGHINSSGHQKIAHQLKSIILNNSK